MSVLPINISMVWAGYLHQLIFTWSRIPLRNPKINHHKNPSNHWTLPWINQCQL